jgi:hypothetical protein
MTPIKVDRYHGRVTTAGVGVLRIRTFYGVGISLKIVTTPLHEYDMDTVRRADVIYVGSGSAFLSQRSRTVHGLKTMVPVQFGFTKVRNVNR